MNAMKKEFDEIIKLCGKRVEEFGENASFFMEAATEEEILDWENKTGIQIPEDYKQWLKLTAKCQMCSTIASLFFPEQEQPDYLPEDYVLIGYVVGDGEVLCFSKSEGEYIRYFEGRINKKYSNLTEFFKDIKRGIKGEVPDFTISEEQIERMLARLAERESQKGDVKK